MSTKKCGSRIQKSENRGLCQLQIFNRHEFFGIIASGTVPPSSAVYERLFARLVMGFGDDQESAMEDYKAASTIMRFNNSSMKSNGLMPY